MSSYNKPLPVEDPDSTPFWRGCLQNKFLIQHCEQCAKPRYPASSVCPHCQEKKFTWKESSGKGLIYSWIVVRHPVPRDVYENDVPYVVALIDLEEGVRIASNVVGCDPDDVYAAMPLQVIFKQVTDGVTLPIFEPVLPTA
jgi:hypothetical protein